ncbi:KDGP aldolase family protein [Erysipelothrix sp. D19-032]
MQEAFMAPLLARMNALDGVRARKCSRWRSRPIYRASITFTHAKDAMQMTKALQENNPKIYTRDYRKNEGIIEVDLRDVSETELEEIARGNRNTVWRIKKMTLNVKYLNDRLALNVLTNSVENAQALVEAAEGHVLVGVLSKNYPTVEAAVQDMKRYQSATDNAISVGLGAGDPGQWEMVAQISKIIQPQHINQMFTKQQDTHADFWGQDQTIVNSLVSPSGKVGYVNVATGIKSREEAVALVPIRTAIRMMQEMGASSIKFFPMNGLSTFEEYKAVCEACAEYDFMLEPTGGLDLENFEIVVKTALDAGVKRVIPHVYSSIIDPKLEQLDSRCCDTLHHHEKTNPMKKKIVAFGEVMMRLAPPMYTTLQQAQTFDFMFTGTGVNVLAGLYGLGFETTLLTALPDNNVGYASPHHIYDD